MSFLPFFRFCAGKNVRRTNFSEVVFHARFPSLLAFKGDSPPPEQKVGGTKLQSGALVKQHIPEKAWIMYGSGTHLHQTRFAGPLGKGKGVR